jgi:hypothetical protein
MNLQGVYSKTALGAQEITTRSLHLDAMTRRLLIIVDGERSAEELMQFFKEGQDISVLFETLIQLELIERTGGPVSAAAPDSIQPLPAKPAASDSPPLGPTTTTVISELQSTDLQAPPANQASATPEHAESHRTESHRSESHRFRQAKTFMEETARKVLGLKGVFFISRIERATDERELFALLDQFQSELHDGLKDRGAAKQYRVKAQAMLEK